MEMKKADVFGHVMSKRSSDARKFFELEMIESDPFAFYGAYLDFLRKPLQQQEKEDDFVPLALFKKLED